jgi:hypothetical protein
MVNFILSHCEMAVRHVEMQLTPDRHENVSGSVEVEAGFKTNGTSVVLDYLPVLYCRSTPAKVHRRCCTCTTSLQVRHAYVTPTSAHHTSQQFVLTSSHDLLFKIVTGISEC